MTSETFGIAAVIAVVAVYVIMLAGLIPLLIGTIKTGIGIKHDATALGNNKGTMFCLLTIFLGAIPAIVYACIRTNAAKNGPVDEALLAESEKKLDSGFKLMIAGNIILIAAIVLLGAAMLFGGGAFVEAIA